jgi:hypothetical protein
LITFRLAWSWRDVILADLIFLSRHIVWKYVFSTKLTPFYFCISTNLIIIRSSHMLPPPFFFLLMSHIGCQVWFSLISLRTKVGIQNKGSSWWWSYGSWISNYLCKQCLSPLKLWVQIPLMAGVLDTTLCDKVCQRVVAGRPFSPCTLVSSNN